MGEKLNNFLSALLLSVVIAIPTVIVLTFVLIKNDKFQDKLDDLYVDYIELLQKYEKIKHESNRDRGRRSTPVEFELDTLENNTIAIKTNCIPKITIYECTTAFNPNSATKVGIFKWKSYKSGVFFIGKELKFGNCRVIGSTIGHGFVSWLPAKTITFGIPTVDGDDCTVEETSVSFGAKCKHNGTFGRFPGNKYQCKAFSYRKNGFTYIKHKMYELKFDMGGDTQHSLMFAGHFDEVLLKKVLKVTPDQPRNRRDVADFYNADNPDHHACKCMFRRGKQISGGCTIAENYNYTVNNKKFTLNVTSGRSLYSNDTEEVWIDGLCHLYSKKLVTAEDIVLDGEKNTSDFRGFLKCFKHIRTYCTTYTTHNGSWTNTNVGQAKMRVFAANLGADVHLYALERAKALPKSRREKIPVLTTNQDLAEDWGNAEAKASIQEKINKATKIKYIDLNSNYGAKSLSAGWEKDFTDNFMDYKFLDTDETVWTKKMSERVTKTRLKVLENLVSSHVQLIWDLCIFTGEKCWLKSGRKPVEKSLYDYIKIFLDASFSLLSKSDKKHVQSIYELNIENKTANLTTWAENRNYTAAKVNEVIRYFVYLGYRYNSTSFEEKGLFRQFYNLVKSAFDKLYSDGDILQEMVDSSDFNSTKAIAIVGLLGGIFMSLVLSLLIMYVCCQCTVCQVVQKCRDGTEKTVRMNAKTNTVVI